MTAPDTPRRSPGPAEPTTRDYVPPCAKCGSEWRSFNAFGPCSACGHQGPPPREVEVVAVRDAAEKVARQMPQRPTADEDGVTPSVFLASTAPVWDALDSLRVALASRSASDGGAETPTVDVLLSRLEDALLMHIDQPARVDFMSLTRAWREILTTARRPEEGR